MRWVALVGSLCVCDGVAAQCRPPVTAVDTGKQYCGVAPRFDFELALRIGGALGDPCFESDDTRICRAPGFATVGGEVVTSFRFWRRTAIGLVGAYDQRIGSTAFGDGDERADYSNRLWRAMFELRWYSRSVATGGLFVALRAGAAWMTDLVSPRDEDRESAEATQIAPVFGMGIGGQFTPYRGIGMTLALHSFLAFFPDEGPELSRELGRALAYSDLIFVGVTWGAVLGTGL